MAKFVENQTNFRAGVLSKKLYGRTDINEYRNGLSVGENAFIGKKGGAYKRFGSRPIMQLPTEIAGTQLISLTLFTNKTMFLVCDGSTVRFYNERGMIIIPAVFLSGTVGLYSAAAFDNTVFITNYDGSDVPITIKFKENENTGLIEQETVVTQPGFLSDSWFNRPMSSVNTDITLRLRLLNVPSAGGADQMESDGTWNLDDYFVVNDIVMITGLCRVKNADRISTGLYQITSFASSTVANVTPAFYYTAGAFNYDALTNLNYTVPGGYSSLATESNWFDEWSYSVWGPNRGWPRMFAVDEGRLIAAGTTDQPATIWGSMTNNPTFFLDRRLTHIAGTFADDVNNITFKTNSFYQGDIVETDPYNFTLSTKSGSEVTFMEASTVLVVGTSRQEYIVSGDGAAISQKNISVRPHTSHGSMRLNSLTFDNAVLFVARNRRQIHLFKYNQENGSYITQEVTVLNDDTFTNDPIKSMAWHEQLGIVFIVTEGRKLVTLTLGEDIDTRAFTFQTIEGIDGVVDVAYGVEEEEDYMMLIVDRNGQTYFDKISERPEKAVGVVAGSIATDYKRLTEKEGNFLDGGIVLAESSSIYQRVSQGIRHINKTYDYVQINATDVKIGDTITFFCDNANVFIDNSYNLSLGVAYYMIPYHAVDHSGVRLATSLANAQSNTYINISGIGDSYIGADDLLTYSIIRNNEYVPVRHIPAGTKIYAIRIDPAVGPVEFEFDVDGTSDTILIGNAFGGAVAYGIAHEFHIATMPVEAGQQWGSAQLGLKRIDKLAVRTVNTPSFRVSSDGYNDEEVIEEYYETVEGRFDLEPYNYRYEIPFSADNEYDQVVHIQNDKPEAVYIASLTMRGVSNDG
jgi:hypothetical protein